MRAVLEMETSADRAYRSYNPAPPASTVNRNATSNSFDSAGVEANRVALSSPPPSLDCAGAGAERGAIAVRNADGKLALKTFVVDVV